MQENFFIHKEEHSSDPFEVFKQWFEEAQKIKDILTDEPHLIWCDTNDEADKLKEIIPDAIEVRGGHNEE